MIKKILGTQTDITATIIRVTLGLVMFPHGAQKVLGWFGGYGFSGTMGFFTTQMGLPWVVAFLVLMAEFLGSLGLIFGLGTRVAAFGMLAVMLGAIFTSHLQYGFFMNWFGQQQGEGFEYHLLVIGMALALMIKGAGSFSLDQKLAK